MNTAVVDLLKREAATAQSWLECDAAIRPRWLVASPEIRAEVARIAQELTLSLGLPLGEFWIQLNGPIGGRPLWAVEVTEALLRISAVQGPEQAAEWLDRVRQRTTVNCRIYAGIHGLRVSEDTDVAGVRFVRLESVADSEAIGAWRNRHMAGADIYSLETVAVLDLGRFDIRGAAGRHAEVEEWRQRIVEILRAVAYSTNGAPSLGEIFSEFNEPDVIPLRAGSGYMSYVENAPRALTAVELTLEAREAAVRHLAVPQGFRSRLNLATDRLATSRRRFGAADKSIDLGIAFEALVGAQKFDVTYKLGLRTAVVLGRSLEERRIIRRQVADLYEIRSRTVHGDPLKAGSNADSVVRECDALCAALILALAKGGRAPDWEATELQAKLTLT